LGEPSQGVVVVPTRDATPPWASSVKLGHGMKKREKGFTILEMVVVSAIIAVMAAIAIPNLLRSRMNSGESIVMDSCHSISTACQNFYSVSQPRTYPVTLQEMLQSSPPYIDPVLGNGVKQGYNFNYQLVTPDTFTLNANPVVPGWTGNRYFFMDESGVLRVRFGAPAGPTDVPAMAV
jgi:type IV pilus assembly protein PilA